MCAIIFAFFACFPALKGLFAFCEYTAESGKRDFGLIFSFLYSIRHFADSFGASLKAAVLLVWMMTPFCVAAFVPPRYSFTEKYALLFEVTAAFLLFYGLFYWLAFVLFEKADRESVSFSSSFLLHFLLVIITKGVWLLPFLPYAALSTVYSHKK